MREEVLVIPPSAERRKSNFYLTKTDEPAFNNAGKKCGVSAATYVKRSSHPMAAVGKDLKAEGEASALQPLSEGKPQTEASRRENRHLIQASEARKCETNEEGRSKQSMRSLSSQHNQKDPLQDGMPLQWGNLKRSRGSRGPNILPKLCNSFDESKTMQCDAVKGSSVPSNSNTAAAEDSLRSKDAAARKRAYPCSPLATACEHTDADEDWRREKRLRSLDLSRGKRGSLIQGSKREDHLLQHCITRSLPGRRLEVLNQATCVYGNEAGIARKDQNLPKFVVSLSRKEMEEDFLLLKGTKLPKRPKHRPKMAEKHIIYCTPGLCLCDVSVSRYIVKEKKRVKGKSKGLKAMESEETNSE